MDKSLERYFLAKLKLMLFNMTGGEEMSKLGGVKFAVSFKAQSNGSDILMQHHSTLLIPECCTRLATMLHAVA